jgi:hypothetical protein
VEDRQQPQVARAVLVVVVARTLAWGLLVVRVRLDRGSRAVTEAVTTEEEAVVVHPSLVPTCQPSPLLVVPGLSGPSDRAPTTRAVAVVAAMMLAQAEQVVEAQALSVAVEQRGPPTGVEAAEVDDRRGRVATAARAS